MKKFSWSKMFCHFLPLPSRAGFGGTWRLQREEMLLIPSCSAALPPEAPYRKPSTYLRLSVKKLGLSACTMIMSKRSRQFLPTMYFIPLSLQRKWGGWEIYITYKFLLSRKCSRKSQAFERASTPKERTGKAYIKLTYKCRNILMQ